VERGSNLNEKGCFIYPKIIGHFILPYSLVAADAEDIPRPELVKIANEELTSKGKI
jgi:hypothetical protein